MSVTLCFEITINRRQFYFLPKLWSKVAWQSRAPDLVEQTAENNVKILCQFQELSRKRGPTFDDEDTEDKKKEAEEHNLLTLVRGFAKLKKFPKKLDRTHPTHPPPIQTFFYRKPITDMDRTLNS